MEEIRHLKATINEQALKLSNFAIKQEEAEQKQDRDLLLGQLEHEIHSYSSALEESKEVEKMLRLQLELAKKQLPN